MPSYFYILFYRRGSGEPYTLYSPYQDGPARLVTGLEDLNDQRRACRPSASRWAMRSRASLFSLIPTEPVDLNSYSPSMDSDVMLSTVQGLPDNTLQKQQLALRRQQEKVTASIVTTTNTPRVGYTVTRDERGQSMVQYLIQFPEPDATLIGERKDKTLGYDLTLQNQITTESGAFVYADVVALTGGWSLRRSRSGRKKPFAAEDRFPLVPGRYIVQSTLTNNLTLGRAPRARDRRRSATVEVRSRDLGALRLQRQPASRRGHDASVFHRERPIQPAWRRHAYASRRRPIPLVFQLWVPKDASGKLNTAPIQLHYLYGSPVSGGKPIDETDETVDPANADAAGNFVTGHVFQTDAIAPGNYRMIIRATQEGSAPVFSTMMLHVVPADVAVGDWTAYGPPRPDQDEQKRALSAKAQAKVDQAKETPAGAEVVRTCAGPSGKSRSQL